ncbi:hypothetical protein H0H87_008370 [Tephrocybe sp. NHM501043]|nr:hypothetical protein H0H87_008370 [Tephrocybe sp. NHM501043]
MPHGGLLSQVRKFVKVDLDSMDPAAARRHEQYTFTDMTSNQAIVYNQATHPENKSLVLDAIEYMRNIYPTPAVNALETGDRLREALDVMTVRMAHLVYPHLMGKVHAQTSPSVSYDAQKTITHARRIVSLFKAHGIPSARVCIKIPATPAGIMACKTLSSPDPDSGFHPINTLSTCVFSVAQARAAAQAGCTYVAPYFNQLRVHFDETTWVKYDDPGREHPMSSVIALIIAALKGSNTLQVASIKNVPEVLALAALRPDHITLSASLLEELAAAPAVAETDIAPITSDPRALEPIDYLAEDCAALALALKNEPDVEHRINDAIRLFGECELRSMEYMRSAAKILGVKCGEGLWTD